MHPFFFVIIATFLLLLGVLMTGIFGIGKIDDNSAKRANKFMFMRVGLGVILLAEILFYSFVLKG